VDGPTTLGVDTTRVGVGVVFTLEVEVNVLVELAEAIVLEDEDGPVEVVELPFCADLEEAAVSEGWG